MPDEPPRVGFPVEEAGAVPVAIWPGDEDRMVPFSH